MAATTINMAPMVVDIKGIRAGDRNELDLQLKADGQPWNTTGATLSSQVRKTALDTEIALTAEIIPVDEAIGHYTLAWDGEEVRALLGGEPSWSGVWDFQVIEAGQAEPVTVAAGLWSCEQDVTRP